MKRSFFAVVPFLVLSGCVAGPLIENLSMKGEPISTVEARYGQPTSQSQDATGGHYVWVSRAGTDRECHINVTTDGQARVTGVQTVGRISACREARHPKG